MVIAAGVGTVRGVAKMSSVNIDGKQVALSREGIQEIQGTKAEVGKKIVEAICASIAHGDNA